MTLYQFQISLKSLNCDVAQFDAAARYLIKCKRKDRIRARKLSYVLLPIFLILWALVAYLYLF